MAGNVPEEVEIGMLGRGGTLVLELTCDRGRADNAQGDVTGYLERFPSS